MIQGGDFDKGNVSTVRHMFVELQSKNRGLLPWTLKLHSVLIYTWNSYKGLEWRFLKVISLFIMHF